MTRVERKARDRAIRELINRGIVKPPGSDCWVFVGHIAPVTNDPVVRHDGKTVHVKRFLRGSRDPIGTGRYYVYRTSCGMGRYCVNPDHNSIYKVFPWAEVQGWLTAAEAA
jgi:hypothetical protein